MEDLEHGHVTINYPEDLDEQKLGIMVQEILDGVDRDRLFQREDFVRSRHPLIKQRLGTDVALNTEIRILVTSIVSGLTISSRFSNQAQIQELGKEAEGILIQAASDPTKFREALEKFKAAVTKLSALNPFDHDPMYGVVDHQIRQRLAMPSLVQEFALYPPVNVELSGDPIDKVLRMARDCRDALLQRLEGKNDEKSQRLRTEIGSEAAAVLEWYEKAVA